MLRQRKMVQLGAAQSKPKEGTAVSPPASRKKRGRKESEREGGKRKPRDHLFQEPTTRGVWLQVGSAQGGCELGGHAENQGEGINDLWGILAQIKLHLGCDAV